MRESDPKNDVCPDPLIHEALEQARRHCERHAGRLEPLW